jgi:hypothetical protein
MHAWRHVRRASGTVWEIAMKRTPLLLVQVAVLLVSIAWGAAARADACSDTIALFQTGQSTAFLKNSYGYAVFPNIGKGGLVVSGARGTGRVYKQGTYVGVREAEASKAETK